MTDVLLNQLEDADSFVYLSVIHTLRVLLEKTHKYTIPKFMSLFESSDMWNTPSEAGIHFSKKNIIRRRILLGEVLVFGVRRAGDLISLYANDILRGCMHVLRFENKLSPPVSDHVESWNTKKMSISHSGSATNSSSIELDLEAERVDHILLRQSALSLVAEVVSVAGYGSSRYMEEITRLSSDVLKVEHSSSNAAISMRRSVCGIINCFVF